MTDNRMAKKDKQRSTKHTHKNKNKSSNTSPTKNREKGGEVKSGAPERLAVSATIQYNTLYLKNQTIITQAVVSF